MSRGRPLVALVAALSLLAPAAAQARSLETVLQDDAQLLHRPEEQLRRSLEELKLLGVDRIRVTAGWSVLTRDPDAEVRPSFDATNPAAYEQERWRNLDRLLILARDYGFKTMIDIAFWAPKWASTDGADDRGRTHIDPAHFRDFSVAVARRYSGGFTIPRPVAGTRPPLAGEDERYLTAGYGTANRGAAPPVWVQLGLPDPFGDFTPGGQDEYFAGARPLPGVDLYTLWNEPNHTGFLRPQWRKVGGKWRAASPHAYRAMVGLAFPAIKSARPDASILIGGTSFNGAYHNKGTAGVPPLQFLRELACVDAKFKPLVRDGCRAFQPLPGDGWAHHPYSMQTEPGDRNRSTRPDDVPIAEIPKLARTLDRLVRMGRLAPGARNIWITEYGYETNPPDTTEKYTTVDQARFLPWAEYLAWRVPTVQSFAQFLLRDLPPGAFRVGNSKRRAFGEWQSGLVTERGEHKVGYRHFRAGIFVERTSGDRLRIFGRLRLGAGATAVIVETRAPGRPDSTFKPITTFAPGSRTGEQAFQAGGTDTFLRFAKSHGGASQRYRVRVFDGKHMHTPIPFGLTAVDGALK